MRFDITTEKKIRNSKYRWEKHYEVTFKGICVGKIIETPKVLKYENGSYIFSDTETVYRNQIVTEVERGHLPMYRYRYYPTEHATLITARLAFEEEFDKLGISVSNLDKDSCKCNPKLLTASENESFYPTPASLAGKMLAGIDLTKRINTILEPSAGKGDLIDYLVNHYERIRNPDVDCIEKDANLRYILEGKEYKVVYDDFLNYNPFKKYDLIVMNPPFKDGCKHLLKALSIQKNGGQICCLLNAETLKNPYTNERKSLVNLLNKYNASVKYVKDAFVSAERKTGVEVAIVWVNIPEAQDRSYIYEGLKRAEKETEKSPDEVTDIRLGGIIDGMISGFNMECKLCAELIREYNAAKPYIMKSSEKYAQPILSLEVNGHECDSDEAVNKCLRSVRYKYWNALMTNEQFTSRLTSTLRDKYSSVISEMADYDFNEFNVKKLIAKMNAEIIGGIEDEIYKVFDKMSAEHSWFPESKENIHYYNGWATNKAHKVGMKTIIPGYGVVYTDNFRTGVFDTYSAYGILSDIEKVFNYLDGNATAEVNLSKVLDEASRSGVTKNIKCKYFDVTFFKKGTVHIKMHPEAQDIIDALNIYVGRGRGWLPPHYGTGYETMSPEEQAVIDEFQGKEEYEKVVTSPEKYLYTVKADSIMSLPEKEIAV